MREWSGNMDRQIWVEYISAMVNLYGIVPVEQVAKVISEQNEGQVSAEDIKTWMQNPFSGGLAKAALQKRFVYPYGSGFFVGEWIMEFDAFEEHWTTQQGKSYYVPEREALLKWSDPSYFEKSKEFIALQEFLAAAFPEEDSEQIEGITEDLQMMAEEPFSLDGFTKEFERRGLMFEKEQMKKAVTLVTDLLNHTRIQVNRGYTPTELFEMEKRHMLPLSGKVGRNDPCPCGSGKKYKKCCGREAG